MTARSQSTKQNTANQSLFRPLAVLVTPRATFESLRAARGWSWIAAFVLLVATALLFGELVYPKLDIEEFARAQLESRFSGAQLDRMVEGQMRFGRVLFVWLPYLLMMPLSCFAGGLVLWLGWKVAGSEGRYLDALSVLLHALMPRALASLLMIPVALAQSRIPMEKLQVQGVLATNLAWLAPDGASQATKAALASVDLFSLWAVFLLVVGSSIVARLGRTRAAVVVGCLWLLFIVTKAALTGLGS